MELCSLCSTCLSRTRINGALNHFNSLRYARSQQQSTMEQLTALQQASRNTSGLGLRQRVCNLTRYSVCFFPPPCGWDRGRRKVFECQFHETQTRESKGVLKTVRRAVRGTNTPGWLEWRIRYALLCHPGMAGWKGISPISGLLSFTK